MCGARQWWARHDANASSGNTERREIVISAGKLDEIRQIWMEQNGSAPTPDQERIMLGRAIDDELLYRRALELGLDRNNLFVRDRVIYDMRFIAEGSSRSEEELLREGLRLGMDREDPSIRRQMIELARVICSAPAAARHPSDAQLQLLLDSEADRFRIPARLSFIHVFISRQRYRGELERRATELLRELRERSLSPESTAKLGEQFPSGSHLVRERVDRLSRLFGEDFGNRAAGLPTGTWAGPLRSAYGMHLLWITEAFPPTMPTLDSVRNQVARLWIDRESRAELRRRLDTMRGQYLIRVEKAAAGGSADVASSRSPLDQVELPRQTLVGD